MSKKTQVSVLCGGQSTEHEISIRSARNIVAAFDPNKYELSVIYITHEGRWYLLDKPTSFLDTEPKTLINTHRADPITIALGEGKQPWQSLKNATRYSTDCVFPVLHGTLGEDGAPQGLLELLGLPYVGAGTQSSAICMQKDITKQLLRSAGVPTVDWHVIRAGESFQGLYEKLSNKFGRHLFVKPASLGSSVGTMPVDSESTLKKALDNALRYDERVLIEPRVYGREVECSVLGNGNPQASLPGEIISRDGFYSYDAKYVDPTAASIEIPAKLPSAIIEKIQQAAIEAFKAVYCTGMARVDFFVVDNKDIFVNELNTIPGFTNISMYPTMWKASGVSYADLLDKLVNLAMDRFRYQHSLIRIYGQ